MKVSMSSLDGRVTHIKLETESEAEASRVFERIVRPTGEEPTIAEGAMDLRTLTEFLGHMTQGRKIPAIKLVRDTFREAGFSMSLKDAKEYVERFYVTPPQYVP